jgi:CheY-like chemotaxis protein
LNARKIIIVDDENDILTVAQASLEMLGGWEVLAAHSGREGIDLAAAEQPDAILLDVMMPDMDGPTTYQMLQGKPETQNIPVVLLTAKAQAADHERLAKLGVNGILSKPFDPLTLSSQLSSVLGWD